MALILTPLEFLDRLATLAPPPRKHRHRYHGVLAPNSPMCPAVTAYAGLSLDTPLPAVPPREDTPASPEVVETAQPRPPSVVRTDCPYLSGPAVALRGMRRRDAAGRVHHRTGTNATHPSAFRRTRHTSADFSSPVPARDGVLRLGSIQRLRRGTSRTRIRSNGELVAHTHPEHRLPTRTFEPGKPPSCQSLVNQQIASRHWTINVPSSFPSDARGPLLLPPWPSGVFDKTPSHAHPLASMGNATH